MCVNPVNVAEPPGVVTLTLPEVPYAPDTAVIVVALTTVKVVAAVPPKLTAVAPLRLVPVIVTVVKLAPYVGVNELKAGGDIQVNPAFVIVPPGVVTLTFPVVPDPTTAVIWVAELTVKEVAAVPPKLTADVVKPVPEKPVPVIMIEALLPPSTGENDVMVGTA